jgi:hypothetical protein
MPVEMREDPNHDEIKLAGPKDGSSLNKAGVAGEASAANEAAYIPPPIPRRWAGRAILSLQKIVDKVLAGRVVQLQGQVIEQDRELSDLVHDMGELTAQVVQMNRRLHSIDERLTHLEETNKLSDPE